MDVERRDVSPRRFAVLALSILSGAQMACSTTQTNMTSARTLEPGEVEANLNAQANVNSTPVRTGIRAGERFQSEVRNTPEDETISEETFREGLDFAVASALFRPRGSAEAGARVGLSDAPLEGIDAGLRYNGSTIKADAKLQYWSSEKGRFAASVQPAFGFQSSVASSTVESITLTDWSRFDYDLLAPVGASFGEVLRLWFAPRFLYSRISTSPKFGDRLRERLPENLRGEIERRRRALFGGGEDIYYVGFNVGGSVGYKHVYLAAEVSASRMIFRPDLLGQQRDLSGFSFMPAAGLIVQF